VASQSIINSIRKYLEAVEARGIEPSFGILYGSQVTGKTNEWSDIDLVVVARRFDSDYQHRDVSLLWRVAALVDSRIEPIPCGVKQWEEDDGTPIIEIARQEGVVVRKKEYKE